jgi:biopolymer transport protein ExbD
MKMSRMTTSGVNAGSMADIAFLLLIFFLVTTTFPDDEGIESVLPKPCPEGVDCSDSFRQNNIFTILLNRNNTLMVNEELLAVNELREKVKTFVDNNGDASCDYCNGDQKVDASDNPKKVIISIKTDRETSYNQYIGMQNELVGAYYELREELSKTRFNKSVEYLTDTELKELKDLYPIRITETDVK